MPLSPDALPLGPGVVILDHHPFGLVALAKPPGVLSHPNRPEDQPRSLLTCPYEEAGERFLLPSGASAYLLHRLDSATSGVVLLATDSDLAALVKKSFHERAVEKTYLALVFGHLRRPQETWHDHLQVHRGGNRLRVRPDAREGNAASTRIRLLRTFSGTPLLSLVELTPYTGRTHQLRVQCGKRRLPIVGDATYGDFSKNRAFVKAGGEDRLFLHASRVTLQLRHRGQDLRFMALAPTPPAFEQPR